MSRIFPEQPLKRTVNVLRIRPVTYSFIVRRHFVLNVANKRNSHLGGVVALQCVADETSFNLHLYLILVRRLQSYKEIPSCRWRNSSAERSCSFIPFQGHHEVRHTGCSRTIAHLGPFHHQATQRSLPKDSLRTVVRTACYQLSNL